MTIRSTFMIDCNHMNLKKHRLTDGRFYDLSIYRRKQNIWNEDMTCQAVCIYNFSKTSKMERANVSIAQITFDKRKRLFEILEAIKKEYELS